jgi:hypothetical protein
LYPVDFRNREEELKNTLATSRSKVRDLEIKVREIEAGGLELKRAMKEASDSEYAISQKLSYETAARRGLEAEFKIVLKSLQSDQTTIVEVLPIMQCLAYLFRKKGSNSSLSLIAW